MEGVWENVWGSVPTRVRSLRKMQNFWENFTDFKPEVNIIKCKTENPSRPSGISAYPVS